MAVPYPSLEDVVQAARLKLNDAILPGGDILTDTQSFTAPYINLAWQKFQQLLVALGYVTLEDETTLLALPAVATLDAGIFVSVSWTGYFDGTANHAGSALPQTLIRPLKLWERSAGSGGFIDMDPILKGLAAVPKQFWNQQWEWRADSIFMPGATIPIDLRIRFAKYLADFVPNSITPFNLQPVPILRSTDSFSGFIAYEMCGARGDADAQALLTDAKEAAMLMLGLDSSGDKGPQKTSERAKMKDRFSGGQQ